MKVQYLGHSTNNNVLRDEVMVIMGFMVNLTDVTFADLNICVWGRHQYV